MPFFSPHSNVQCGMLKKKIVSLGTRRSDSVSFFPIHCWWISVSIKIKLLEAGFLEFFVDNIFWGEWSPWKCLISQEREGQGRSQYLRAQVKWTRRWATLETFIGIMLEVFFSQKGEQCWCFLLSWVSHLFTTPLLLRCFLYS